MSNSRQPAFLALREVHRHQAFADVALDRTLHNAQLTGPDRRLVTELVMEVSEECGHWMPSLTNLLKRNLLNNPQTSAPFFT